ncbi:MAG: hypothetical protein AAF418_05400 [Pseudomonadota bacterium]
MIRNMCLILPVVWISLQPAGVFAQQGSDSVADTPPVNVLGNVQTRIQIPNDEDTGSDGPDRSAGPGHSGEDDGPVVLQSELLRAIDPALFGFLHPANGGFAIDLWQGIDAGQLERHLTNAPFISRRGWIARMVRKQMLTQATLPGRLEDHASLIALRVRWLMESGFIRDAGDLLDQIPESFMIPKRHRLVSRLAVYRGDLAAACASLAAGGDQTGAEALSCLIVEGNIKAAGQLHAAMQARGEALSSVMQQMLGVIFTDAPIDRNVAQAAILWPDHLAEPILFWHLDLVRLLQEPIARMPAFVLHALVESPQANLAMRAWAVEQLGQRGVLGQQEFAVLLAEPAFGQVPLQPDGPVAALYRAYEWRFFIRNLQQGRFAPERLLAMARQHDQHGEGGSYGDGLYAFYAEQLVQTAAKVALDDLAVDDAAAIAVLAARTNQLPILRRMVARFPALHARPELALWLLINRIDSPAEAGPAEAVPAEAVSAFAIDLVRQVMDQAAILPAATDGAVQPFLRPTYALAPEWMAVLHQGAAQQQQGLVMLMMAQMAHNQSWHDVAVEQLARLVNLLQRSGLEDQAHQLLCDMLGDLLESL